MSIRRAEPRDVEEIITLIRELAMFEKSAEHVQITPRQVRESFFEAQPNVFCDIYEAPDGSVAGLAIWFLNYSTWTGTHGVYLEDLYVRPGARGRGYGRELLAHLARHCVEHGYQRLQWSVLDWNRSAIDFYESLGARASADWVGYRVTGEALASLADL